MTLPLDGPSAPPRRNGELRFAAPWQARLFGVTLDLVEQQRLSWKDFQRRLVAAVGERDARDGETGRAVGDAPDIETEERYYRCWLSALELTLLDGSTLERGRLAGVIDELAARPHGHDHSGHDHDHLHPHDHRHDERERR
ncbi:MAG: nitrile hydratase accessory protein [Acidobacteria bacterium]|nr:MAG: nitrile hydratase accessory protein [Acidobacteriota bacterium]REK00927.1 MAG: nitrile hydratase accessory protein [Acidobacteriota bacterium]